MAKNDICATQTLNSTAIHDDKIQNMLMQLYQDVEHKKDRWLGTYSRDEVRTEDIIDECMFILYHMILSQESSQPILDLIGIAKRWDQIISQ